MNEQRPADTAPEGFELLFHERDDRWSVAPIYVDRTTGRLRMLATKRHSNRAGMLHGGALATFADYQIGAVIGAEELDSRRVTISLSLDFVAPASAGTWIEARVSLVKRTSKLAFTQALILSDDKVIARSSAIYRV